MTVGPASGVLKGAPQEGWAARDVALTVLVDRCVCVCVCVCVRVRASPTACGWVCWGAREQPHHKRARRRPAGLHAGRPRVA
jgi:hypothetical protein